MRHKRLGTTKITASVTLEVEQLKRLNDLADRIHVSRSTIVRDALEREFERYEPSGPSARKVAMPSDEEGSGTGHLAMPTRR